MRSILLSVRSVDNIQGGIMARIKVAEVIDHLDSDIRHALRDAVKAVIPGVHFDEYQLYREFRRAIDRKCSNWERVPDIYVETDNIG